MQKELDETKDKLTAVERILAKKEEEDSRLNKIVEEMEVREKVPGAKKKAAEKKPAAKKKTPAKKKAAPKKKK